MIRFFAQHPTAANLLMGVLLAMGLLTISRLRRETFPNFSPEEVEIRYLFPGASAQEVEETICQRVEDALDGVKFIEEIRGDAREGMAVITVGMVEGADVRTFKDEIQSEIDAIDDLPPDVEDPVVKQLFTTEPVLDVLVSGPMTPRDLKAYAEDLKERLQQLPEVALVEVRGFSDHQLRIELSRAELLRYDLSVAEVADIVSRQNLNLPAGAIEARDREIVVRFVEERRTPSQLEELVVVAGRGGAEVRLGDIARVSDVFELEEEKIEIGRQRAALLHLEKTRNQDTVRVADAVKSYIADERERMPKSMEYVITNDLSILVVDRLQLLLKNFWQGGLLVIFTLWLFFNFKLAFWVVMSLPVSFLGAAFFLPSLGMTINMFSMIAILLALGLLMDDGIVIAENIATHFSRGKTAMQAAIDGVSEVKAGVFSSFLTTVVVLGPLMFVRGDLGKVLKVLPIVLILVMAVSLIEAFLILPSHLGHSLRREEGAGGLAGFRRRLNGAIEWTRDNLLGRTIDRLIEWRYLWIGCVVAAFLVSAGLVLGGVLRFEAFPALDGNTVTARLLMPQGAPLSRTEQVVQQITDGLERVNQEYVSRHPGSEDLVQTVYVQYNQNADALENGSHVATVMADLMPAEKRAGRVDDILAQWRKETGRPADVVSLVFSEPAVGPAGRAIEVRLYGRDLPQLTQAAAKLRLWLSQFAGVSNLMDDLRPGKEEFRLRLREGAFGLGLDASIMARQVRAAFQGVIADEFQVGRESLEIDVRLEPSDQDSLADLDHFHFTLADGSQVPLQAVAEVERERGWSRIARVNRLPAVTIRGDVDSRISNTAALMAEMEKNFAPTLKEEFPGVKYSIEGQVDQTSRTLASIQQAGLIGVLGVFILLSFQFRSYVEPLIVMLAIPFALMGVIWGHLMMGYDLSIPSVFGFVSLAGVVVNDSILLVLFLKARRQEGASAAVSAGQASRQRFRAIALTSITTIAGLMPLLLERSLQAQVLIPLAISIVFGLLASTVLVLLVIPCLYVVLTDWGLAADR